MTKLIKNTLEIKLKDLDLPFSYSDIHVHKSSITNKERIEIGFSSIDRKYILTIKDYENIVYSIYIGYDDNYFHYCFIKDNMLGTDIFASSIADVFTAIQKAVLQLGYSIYLLF